MKGRETETGGQALLERRARHIASGRGALIERDRRGEQARDAAAPADLFEVITGIARLEERLVRLETRLAADD